MTVTDLRRDGNRDDMKRLYPSYSNPETWRDNTGKRIGDEEWRRTREPILIRDDHACRYCGFRAEKWQIVHHIDGNPDNNKEDNLETICPMCNLICHAGQGCVVQGIIDLYEESDHTQNQMITITRRMRANGRRDGQTIAYLGLRGRVPFKMSRMYLRDLFGFVTSRKAEQEWVRAALEYGYMSERKKGRAMNRSLSDFPGTGVDGPARPKSPIKATMEPQSGARMHEIYFDEGWEDAAEEFYRTHTVHTGEPLPPPELSPPTQRQEAKRGRRTRINK